MAEIVLPAMNVQQEAKTKNLLNKIAEFMEVEFEVESVIVMKVKFNDQRQDFGTIIKKLVSKAVVKEVAGNPDPTIPSGTLIQDPHSKKVDNPNSQ